MASEDDPNPYFLHSAFSQSERAETELPIRLAGWVQLELVYQHDAEELLFIR